MYVMIQVQTPDSYIHSYTCTCMHKYTHAQTDRFRDIQMYRRMYIPMHILYVHLIVYFYLLIPYSSNPQSNYFSFCFTTPDITIFISSPLDIHEAFPSRKQYRVMEEDVSCARTTLLGVRMMATHSIGYCNSTVCDRISIFLERCPLS